MEAKADRLLDTAESTSELQMGMEDDTDTLVQKYGRGSSASVEDELAALKAALTGGE